MYIYSCLCMYVCIYVCVYVSMYVCMYVHMYVRTYVRMYVFLLTNRLPLRDTEHGGAPRPKQQLLFLVTTKHLAPH